MIGGIRGIALTAINMPPSATVSPPPFPWCIAYYFAYWHSWRGRLPKWRADTRWPPSASARSIQISALNYRIILPHEYRRGNGQENFGTRYEKPFFRLPFHSTRRNEGKVVDRWPTKFLWSFSCVRLRIFRSSAEKKKKKTEERLCIVSLCSPRDRKRLWRTYELYRSN